MSWDNSAERCQNRRNTMKEAIEQIYKSNDFYDVTFTVGRKKFKAHKLVLSSRCSEFSRILMDPHAATDIIVEEESVTETGFEILLRFIYTDTLGTTNKLSIVQAYHTAKYYKQKKMIAKCEELMQSWSLTIDDACEILNASLGIVRLRDNCLDFIKRNGFDVISSPSFFSLSYASMDFILEKNALKDVDLVERITKIIEWGKKKQRNPGDIKAVRAYFLQSRPALLSKIKIEELKLQDLSLLFSVKYLNLLTPDEIMKFMNYNHSKEKDVLPEWYNAA